jgi:hypothetical protein
MNLEFDEMKLLGQQLKGKFDQYEKDRRPVEEQWATNLRQYLRQYDPAVLKLIPAERSHVYPGDTRVKVKGKVAKMMEMMFPSQENNWELAVSPVPSIPQDALAMIIDKLNFEAMQAAQQAGQVPQPVSSEAIEREVKAFAEKRKDAMQAEIADQLADPLTDYPQMAKRVLRSGTIFGIGVARTGQVRTQSERLWQADELTGGYKAVTKTLKRPYPEYVRVWRLYPDLSALTWEEQEGIFEEFVFNRHDFGQIGKRPDFRGDVIKEYLKLNREGNYQTRTYETELHAINGSENLADRNKRRYQAYRWFGFVSAHDLEQAGVEIKESERDQDVLADVWIIDDIVIKAEVAPFGTRPSDLYHVYIPAEDEDAGLTGVGLPEDVRDSQMEICASARAKMDNMAAIAGPIFEVNKDLLPAGRKGIGAIHAFMTIEREGVGSDAQAPCVRPIFVPSHIAEIMEIEASARQQLDIESNLPAFTMGNVSQPLGEAFRTSNNMSMMMGGANMVTKDDVRAFDRFTSGVIGSFLAWNMEFNPREEIKGDFQARAKGNLSLVAKEVRGAALDQMVQTMDDEEKLMVDKYGVLEDRFKSRDLSTTRLLPREEAMAAVAQFRQGQQEMAQAEAGLTQAKTGDLQARAQKTTVDAQIAAQAAEATIAEIMSRVEANIAQAKSAREKNQLENLKLLLTEGLKGGEAGGEK